MALEGFEKVAVIKYGSCSIPYYFAIYDDGIDYKVGDMVVFSGKSNPTKISEIISCEEWKYRTNNKITEEVIGRVDISAYEERVKNRKEKERLKKELQKRKKEIQSRLDDEYYAEKDEVYANLLREYNIL